MGSGSGSGSGSRCGERLAGGGPRGGGPRGGGSHGPSIATGAARFAETLDGSGAACRDAAESLSTRMSAVVEVTADTKAVLEGICAHVITDGCQSGRVTTRYVQTARWPCKSSAGSEGKAFGDEFYEFKLRWRQIDDE